MPLLDQHDHEFFHTNGYLLVEDVIPADRCERVIDDIYEFTGRDPDDASTWYDPPKGLDEQFSSAGMIEMYHTQSMWDVRQHPRLYQAFAELLETEQLWTSLDRVNMTPPAHPDHPDLDMGFTHWDLDITDVPRPIPSPYGVQGVVYLADTTEEQGGFQCVPSMYRAIDEDWIDDRIANRDKPNRITDEDLEEHPVEPIPGSQGDLVIWDRLTPHGNGSNRANEPRFAQYINLRPASWEDVDRREYRIDTWRESREPRGGAFPGDPRELEQETGPATLTPLGRKLLGIDPWHGWLNA